MVFRLCGARLGADYRASDEKRDIFDFSAVKRS